MKVLQKFVSILYTCSVLQARSDVFEAESEGESEKSEDLQEGSCPVLIDDKDERVSTTLTIRAESSAVIGGGG